MKSSLFLLSIILLLGSTYSLAEQKEKEKFYSEDGHLVGIGYSDGSAFLGVFGGEENKIVGDKSALNFIFEQGVGEFCPRNNTFYAPVQTFASKGGARNYILSIDIASRKYELSPPLPFVVYEMKGFGYSLAVDKSNCDVYVVGRSSIPKYQYSHMVYKYVLHQGLEKISYLGDTSLSGEPFISVAAFDPVHRNLWILQQLEGDAYVNLHAINVETGDNVQTIENEMGIYSLSYDPVSGNLYGFVRHRPYGVFRLALAQINTASGEMNLVKTYDDFFDMIISVATISAKKHQLMAEIGNFKGMFFTRISLDDFNVISSKEAYLPAIISSID